MGKTTLLVPILLAFLLTSTLYGQCPENASVSISADRTSICEGERITFQSSVSNATALQKTYRWKLNGNNISGATSNSFSATTLSNSDKISLEVVLNCDPSGTKTINSNRISVTVFNYPTVTKPQDITVCNGESISAIQFTGSSVSGTTYQWTNNTTSIGLAASGNGNISSFNAVNNGNSPVTAQITVTPTANNCQGSPKTFTITVNPTPSVTKPQDITVCNGESISTIQFTGSSVSGTTYQWTNNTTSIGLAASGNGNINSFNAVNNGNTPVTAQITVTPTANNCQGSPETFTITVNPTPSVTVPNNIEVCTGEQISTIFIGGSPVSGTSYIWQNDNPNIGLASTGTGDISEFIAKNTTNTILTATINITPKANDCEGSVKSFTITVNPTPTITKPNDVEVCADDTVTKITFPGASVNGTIRKWINDTPEIGLPASGNGNIDAFTATNNTNQLLTATITLTPVANDCEGISETFQIRVKPKPTLMAPDDKIFCSGVTTTAIIENILDNAPSGTTFDISGGSSIGLADRSNLTQIPSFTPINNSATNKTATIVLTPKANACIGESASFQITINPKPTVSISPSSQQICSGDTTNITFSGSVSGTSFNWTVNAPATITGSSVGSGNQIAQELINNGNQPEIVEYTVTPLANNCNGTPLKVRVTVNPTPEIVLNIPNCTPNVDLTSAQLTAGSSSGLTFEYFTDTQATNALRNPQNVGLGTYYIKGTSNSGCSAIEEIVIDQIEPSIINLDAAPKDVCSGDAFDFAIESNITGTTFSWRREMAGENPASESDDRNSGNPNETLLNQNNSALQATYVFKLTAPGGCSSTQEITVNVLPQPKLIQNPIEDICNGSQINYTPQSNLSNASISWTRNAVAGNPAASGNGTINEILYNDTGIEVGITYFFTITSAQGCTSEESISFSLLSGPKVVASASKIEICPGDTVNLFSEIEGSTTVAPVLLDENFNGNAPNWSRINNSSGGNVQAANWTLRPNNYSPGYNINISSNDNSRFFMSDSDEQGRNTYTESILKYKNPINTVGYTSLELSFWQYYIEESSVGEFQVSTNNRDWQTVYNINFTTRGMVTVNLDGYVGQQNLYIRFRYRANWGYWWALDNVKITGESASTPNITWTSSTDENWTSSEKDPQNVRPPATTIYTVKYTDPELECPGVATVEVLVRKSPKPKITANYCGDSEFIELVAEDIYSTYYWSASGERLYPNDPNKPWKLDVDIAQTYTLFVEDELGCSGSGSINVSDELVLNGDFENSPTNNPARNEYNRYNFYTEYGDRSGTPLSLYPEGLYAIDDDANFYHNNFFGKDHTTGNGNFLIVNGHPDENKVVWRQTIENIQPNTDYYFSAWGMNLNDVLPAKLQFLVNGVPTGTIADLTNVPVAEWVQFYSNPFWNSGNNTSVVLEIINTDVTRNGNDFGLDDISFGTLEQIVFEINPDNNSVICEGQTLELYANIEGGRDPIEFNWTGPNGFSSNEENPIIENATAAMAGTYTLSVTDFYGCTPTTGTTQVDILIINAGENQILCSNAAEIQLMAEITGSTAGGSWSGGTGTFTSTTQLDAVYTPSASEIAAGNVTLILTSNDTAATCTDEVVFTFNSAPDLTIETTNILCFQSNDGTATVSVTENTGTSPFTYLWEDGQTTQTAINLAPNQVGYEVTVTDVNGCATTITSPPILEPSAVEIKNVSATDVTCFGGNDGSATIEVSGGNIENMTPNYNFTVLDNSGEALLVEQDNSTGIFTAPDLPAGTYTFTVNSGSTCTTSTATVTVIEPIEILVEAGDPISPEECGITTVRLNADPADPNLGNGSWSIISPSDGGGGSFADATDPKTRFTGQTNTTYELQWTITPLIECPTVSDVVNVKIPEACSKLDFDGIDDYIDFGNTYDFRGDSFTLEAWVKPKNNALSGVRTIISKRDPENTNIGYDLILNNGAPSFRVRNKTVISSSKLNTDRWYHIAGIFKNGNEVQLYVDGILIQSNNNVPGGTGTLDYPFIIGAAYDATTPTQTKEHFHGWIEEVRVWNTSLTQGQVQFMMNQRLENNGGSVKGEVLPMNTPGNLSWSSLEGYYRLLPGEIANGLTLDRSSNKIAGILKNILTIQENTAPLPYISNKNGSWRQTSTWLRPTVWDVPNGKGINGEPINWNIARIKHNINSTDTDIYMLGLLSESGELLMDGNVDAQTGQGLTVSHYLELDGSINLEGESQLIQTEGSILAESSVGFIDRDQQGTANSFNYNYWTSPVSLQGQPNNSGYNIESVLKDGTDPKNVKNLDINYQYHWADSYNANSGAKRISAYWFYSFFGTADQYGEWYQVHQDENLLAGQGYTMKGTSGSSAISDLQNYVFRGKPNNGTIRLPIGTNQNRLVGNPYPSAIDAEEFIRDNLKDVAGGRSSSNVFNGAIYFWDHFGPQYTHVLEQYVGGYAAYNLSGGVPAAATDDRIDSSTNLSGSKTPGRYIPVAQAFFINSVLDDQFAANVSVTGGNITFKNSQRVFAKESSGNSQFLKPIYPTKEKQAKYEEDTRLKIRLKFSSPKGYHRQILVTRDELTTNGFDLGYEAPLIDDNVEDMYWKIDEAAFVIQAVPNFDLEQVLPLGIRISEEKEFTIKIERLENFDKEIEIYILDKETNTYHDLTQEDYKNSLPPDEYTNRFELVFQKKNTEEEPDPEETEEEEEEEKPDTNTPEDNADTNGEQATDQDPDNKDKPGLENNSEIEVDYLSYYNEVALSNPQRMEFSRVEIYSISGQRIMSFEEIPTQTLIKLPFNRYFSSAVYIVKAYCKDGRILNKKFIIKR